jgi:UDP-3-O-[3-hydroxymyristoyl] N-acetylglucosamine deacetylase
VEFAHPLVGKQRVNLVVNRESFEKLLSTARTFCFLEDVDRLRAAGLARGGSLDNAIVLTRDGVMNGPLRSPDEFVRHKALDLVGDLALLGRPLLGRVEAHKAGHALHTQLVSKLLANPALWTETSSPELEDRVSVPRATLKRSISAHAAD